MNTNCGIVVGAETIIKLSAKVVSETVSSVAIEWDGIIHDADVYEIEQFNKKLGWLRVCWTSSLSGTVEGLEDNFAYRFRVKALKVSEDKGKYLDVAVSPEIVGTTLSAPPSTICMYRAIKKGQHFLVKRLLRRRPSLIEYSAPNGYLPLANAIIFNEMSVIDVLLSAGANVHNGNPTTGRTPLHLAFYNGNLPISRLLINKKTNIDARDIHGLTPCHYAVDANQCEILKFAFDCERGVGADIEAADNAGYTLLLRAVIMHSDLIILKLLIAQGANVKATNGNGLTCSQLAKLFRNAEAEKYFNECGKIKCILPMV